MARTRARRRASRLTPRRWLPFLALVALVVAAAVAEPEPAELSPEDVDASLDLAAVPAVTGPDAISTAWYCAGGTAAGDDGVAELTVVFANDAELGATAEVTTYDADGALGETETIDLPANGRARFTPEAGAAGEWVGVLAEVRGGRVAVEREVAGPLGFDVAPCATEASDRWYVASGSTLRGATERLSLFNPFPDSASVDIVFATDTGPRSPRAFRGLTIPGGSVRVVEVNDAVDERTEVAATVRARTGRVVVDRIQTYDGTGDPIAATDDVEERPAPEGLVSTPAIPVRADRWVFPGARVAQGVRTEVAVYNPSGRTAEVDLVVTPQEPDRSPEVEPVQLSLPPQSEEVVDLATVPGLPRDMDLWIDVRSLDGVPVVAERTAFFSSPSARTGATVVAGLPIAASRWLVVQGGETDARTAGVAIANPGPRDATITVVQLSGGNRVELPSAEIVVPAGDRRALVLDDAAPAATLLVTSTEPVVVGSTLAQADEAGIAVTPAFAYPETTVAVPPVR